MLAAWCFNHRLTPSLYRDDPWERNFQKSEPRALTGRFRHYEARSFRQRFLCRSSYYEYSYLLKWRWDPYSQTKRTTTSHIINNVTSPSFQTIFLSLIPLGHWAVSWGAMSGWVTHYKMAEGICLPLIHSTFVWCGWSLTTRRSERKIGWRLKGIKTSYN